MANGWRGWSRDESSRGIRYKNHAWSARPSWPSAKQVSLTISHLGRYRIVREIASGGMAKVYLAVVDGLDKLVALKVIHPNLAQEDAFVRMFLDEARIASSICHRNVCSVFDFGECEGTTTSPWSTWPGRPCVRSICACERWPSKASPKEHAGYVAHVIAEACEGLHSAHETRGWTSNHCMWSIATFAAQPLRHL